MRQDVQIFSNTQKSFTFCDYDWHPAIKVSHQVPTGNTDIYLWECGFSTGETLLEFYQTYGEDFTKLIKFGDSSFVLYDSIKEVVIVARDFMGNYPLYYYNTPDRKGNYIFTFSMNSLLKSNLVEPKINYAKVVEYIECNLYAPPNNYTFYRDVYRLLPAYILRINKGKISELKRYGKFNLLKYQAFTNEEYIEQFRELFIKSIKKQTGSYKNVAASLSGGLDSSSICSVAQSLNSNPIHTFNFKTQTTEAQEDDYLESVVEKWHTIHRTVQPGHSGYEATKKIIQQNGQPHFVLNHTIQLDLISAAKQESCDVFLSGHWGDQVVGYGTQYIEELAIEKDWPNLKKAIAQHFKYPINNLSINESFSTKSKEKLIRLFTIRLLWNQLKNENKWISIISLLRILVNHFDYKLTDFGTIIWQRFQQKKRIARPNSNELLQLDILKERDRIIADYPMEVLDISTTVSGPINLAQERHLNVIFKGNQTYGQEEYFEVYRQNSIRSAQPFFDAELLELSLSIPLCLKFDEGRKRGSLRNALKDYLPEKIVNRTTKAVFTNHYVTLFKELWKEFDANTPANHPIWKIVNKNVFDKNVRIVLDNQHYADSRHVAMPSVMRVINLAIWLDYLEDLKK